MVMSYFKEWVDVFVSFQAVTDGGTSPPSPNATATSLSMNYLTIIMIWT